MRLESAALIASWLLVGCATEVRTANNRDYYRNSCSAPAVGLCAGCEVSCSHRAEAFCEPGRSVPPQDSVAGYCADEASCRCR
jgi:hypothetical protein